MNLLYLLITVCYAIGCCYFGLFILSLFLKPDETGLSIGWYAKISSGFLLGQGILANVWLLMGVAGVFMPGLIYAIFLGVFGISFIFMRKNRIELLQPARASIDRVRGLPWYWQGLAFLIALIFAYYGVLAVATPPLGDAAAFYMVLPKIIAASQRLVPQPNYYDFSQIGLSAEMHYAALMSAASPQAAKLFVWFTFLALAGMLLSLSAEVGNSRIGKIVSLALLVSSTTVTYYIFDGKVDIFGAAFGLAAYYWALRTEKFPAWAPCLLAGVFTGFAIIDKLTSIPVLVPGIAILIVWSNFSRQVAWKDRYLGTAKCLCMFCLIAFCTMIPHFIKNYALFGEPFAPILFLKAGGRVLAEQAYFSYEATRNIVMTYPIALVYGKYPMQDGNISVLVLAFAPLLFVFPEHNRIAARRIRQIAVIALVGVVIWVLLRPSWIMPRYFLATILLFIPLAARGVERLFSEQTACCRVLRGVVFLSMLLVACKSVRYKQKTVNQFAQHMISQPSDYSPGNSENFAFEFVNRMVQPGERVFFAGYHGYFYSPEVLQCINGPNEHVEVNSAGSSPAPLNWAYLYDRGFSYFLLDKRTHKQMADALRIDIAPPWLSVKKVFDDESCAVYKITSLDAAKKPSYVCRQIKPPAWDVVKMPGLETPR